MKNFFFMQMEYSIINWSSFFKNKIKKSSVKNTLLTLNKSVNVYKKARSQYFKKSPITFIYKKDFEKNFAIEFTASWYKKYLQVVAIGLMQKQPQIKIYWRSVVKCLIAYNLIG